MQFELLRTTQFLVFSSLAGVGLAWLLVTQLIGDHEVDADHDAPALSPRLAALFMTCFGAMAGGLTAYGATPVTCTFAGLATALPITAGWVLMVRWLRGQEANSLPEGPIVGRTATTRGELRPGQTGEITFSQAGNLVVRPARTAGPVIPANAPVRIRSFDGNLAAVEPLEPSASGGAGSAPPAAGG